MTAVGGGEMLNWLILAPEDMLKMAAGVCLDMLQGYRCIRRALSKKVMVSFS